MSTETKTTGIHSDIMPDAQIVTECVAAGRPIPPDVSARVHERAERIRKRVFQEHGLVDIGVPAIREFRGELPLP